MVHKTAGLSAFHKSHLEKTRHSFYAELRKAKVLTAFNRFRARSFLTR